MVMDSLRYWKQEMHVDGFRFDLASVFSRNADGSLNWGYAPIFSEIAADPELGRLRLIAEPWDTALINSAADSRASDLASVERTVSRRYPAIRQRRPGHGARHDAAHLWQ